VDFLTALNVSASGLSAERTRVNLAASNLANAETTRGPGQPESGIAGVRVAEVAEDDSPGRRVFNPSHPDADPSGYVTLPNVNPVHEVVNLITAQRGYEANATAIDTLKTMATRALDITK